MNEDEKDIIKAGAEGIAKGLAEKIPPLYQDLIQPSSKIIGVRIATAIKIAISTLSVAIWGYDKIEEELPSVLGNKLQNVPIENIISPDPLIAGPAIENMRFLGNEPDLRDMFAQLIANSMNKETYEKIHPGFVETLKNLSSSDAKFIKEIFLNNNEEQFYFREYPEINYVNLERLGVFKFISPGIGDFSKSIHFNKNVQETITYGFTEYGKLFCEACLE